MSNRQLKKYWRYHNESEERFMNLPIDALLRALDSTNAQIETLRAAKDAMLRAYKRRVGKD